MPATRVLRGEQFDQQEIIARPLRGRGQIHLVISGRPLRDQRGAISGAALVYHDITASRDTERQAARGAEAGGDRQADRRRRARLQQHAHRHHQARRRCWWRRLQGPARPAALSRAVIDEAAERCAGLIKHLLAFARKQPLQPHNVDINRQVADIAKLLAPDPRRADRDRDHPQQGRDAGPYRPVPAHQRRGQPGDQCARRHAERRQADAGDVNTVLDEAYVAANPDVQAGAYVMLAISRHRHRHAARGAANAPSSRSSPPRRSARAPGLGCPWSMASSSSRAATSRSTARKAVAPTIRLYLPPATGAIDAVAERCETAEGGSETILVVEDDALVRGFVIDAAPEPRLPTMIAPTMPARRSRWSSAASRSISCSPTWSCRAA